MRNATRKLAPVALGLALMPGLAVALDPSAKQAVCDEIQQSARNAASTAVQVYSPKTSPTNVFNQATQACLEVIVQYNKIPMGMINIGVLQPLLQQLGRDLVTKSCNAAKDRFQQTLNEALADQGLRYSNGNLTYSGSGGSISTNGSGVNVSGSNDYLGTVNGSANADGSGSVNSSNSGGLLNWGGDKP